MAIQNRWFNYFHFSITIEIVNNFNLNNFKLDNLPTPPKSVWKLLGPSFILIGLGLGSGELILWPSLVSNYGLGIMWGALLGITFQYFLNMEIERYTLANGESVFVGFARMFKILPFWFILSTLIAWSWPAFAVTSSSSLEFFNFNNINLNLVAIIQIILIALIITLGPTLYKTVETFQKLLILIGMPVFVIIFFFLVDINSILQLLKGLVGVGEGYILIPRTGDFPWYEFLGAIAFSGAGGNLLLAQSFYIKDKGYAMGKFATPIKSLITNKSKQNNIEITGTRYINNIDNNTKMQQWWKMANLEHLTVFWGLGLATMLMLAVISYVSNYGNNTDFHGLSFIFNQANVISFTLNDFFANTFIVVIFLFLFSTQLAVTDGAARIITENAAIIFNNKQNSFVQRFYYIAVLALSLFGILIILLGFDQPLLLVTITAVINMFCMVVFSGLLNRLNNKFVTFKATNSRKIVIYISFIFFLALTIYTLLS